MRKWNFLVIAVLATLLAACNQTKNLSADQMQETKQMETMTGETFGAAFTANKVVAYDDMVQQLGESDTLHTQVVGKVESVCQAKGCWMNIVADQDATPEMMVKFKDYGFFMPKDIVGKDVVMNGIAFYEVTPVDELRHYAEDAGKSTEEIAAITEPKKELKFLADGVILVQKEK